MLAVCASSLKLDGIVKGMIDDNCVLDFFNHTTHLFNGPWNCSNHAGTCGHFNQVVFAVIHSPCYFNASKPNYWLRMCAHGTMKYAVYLTFQTIYSACTNAGQLPNSCDNYVTTHWDLCRERLMWGSDCNCIVTTSHWDSKNICVRITITALSHHSLRF